MGLLDKFKNLFTDEEIVEVTKEIEIEETKTPKKLPTVMQDQIEKLELTKQIIKEQDQVSDRDLVKTKTKFNFPVEFDETEVKTNRNVLTSRVNRNQAESKTLYNMSKDEFENTKKIYGTEPVKKETEAKKFYRSPVISPVYGVLDKNYKKEELKSKDENSYEIPRTNKKIDFESVRKKAFGTLADEIKDSILCDDCELKKASLKIEKQVSDDDLLYDITIEKEIKENNDIEDNYNDFGVSYEIEEEVKEDIKPTKISVEVETYKEDTLEDDILNSNNEETKTSEVEIVNCNENEVVAEKIEVKEELKKEEKIKDNLELTDDLFNLIDSMYQNREE